MEDEEKIEANRKAIEYLQSFNFKCLGKATFKDSLIIVSENDEAIGEMNTSVEETIRNEEVCYLVKSHTYCNLNGVSMGNSITAYVSRGMKTLDLTEHEYSEVDGKVLDKKTVFVYDSAQYNVKKTISKGGDDSTEIERVFPASSLIGYISDAATIILERIMCIKQDIPESAVFLSLDTSLNLVAMTYEKLLDEMVDVEDEQMQSIGIQREHKSIFRPVLVTARFLMDGHLVSHRINGTQYQAKLLKRPLTEEEIASAEIIKPEKEDLHWQEDMQLNSYFIERKEELMNDHQTYLHHKPELQAMLKDFLQFVLLRKPDDICRFAADYFGSLSTKKIAPSLPSDNMSLEEA